MRVLIAGLFVFLLTAPPGFGASESVPVGGRELIIPAPEGFVRCDGISAELDETLQSFVPPQNRCVAYFAPPEIQEKLKAGEYPDIPRNFHIQIARADEKRDIGAATAAALMRQVRKELGGMERAEWTAKVEENGNDAGVDFELIGEPVVFHDSETGIGFTTLLAAEAGDEVLKAIVSCMITVVNGKLLYFYATMPFESLEQTRTNEENVLKWAKAAKVANPDFVPSFRMQNTGIIVAVLAIAAVVILLRKSKQGSS